MRFLKRDLSIFGLFKPAFVPDEDGDGLNIYEKPSVSDFCGNIQPFSQKINPEAYGINLKYAYVVYTPDILVDFKELDRIFDGLNWYEIKVIQRWRRYLRLMVEEVTVRG